MRVYPLRLQYIVAWETLVYLRGMCGPETPTQDGVPAGVFSWRPPTALVLELSDLLDGSHAAATPSGGAR